jgi:hypothetical protein
MKHIKLIKDEQVLEQISGGRTALRKAYQVTAPGSLMKKVLARGFGCNRSVPADNFY